MTVFNQSHCLKSDRRSQGTRQHHLHIGLNNDFSIGVNLLPKLPLFVDFVLYVNYNKNWQTLNGATKPEIIDTINKRKLESLVSEEEL